MYWFTPHKKYDPEPYSRLLRAWHWLVGCPIQRIDLDQNGYGLDCFALCDCGYAWNMGNLL
jgi:hypothetical protein